MGYTRHKAFVVTAAPYEEAWKELDKIYEYVLKEYRTNWPVMSNCSWTITPIFTGVNGVKSFAILPDGSYENWPESDFVDKVIEDAIKLILQIRYEDRSSKLAFGYMQFHDDEDETWLRARGHSSLVDYVE